MHVKINVFNHTFQVKMLIFLLRFYICYQLESFTGKFPSLVNLIFDFQNIKEVMIETPKQFVRSVQRHKQRPERHWYCFGVFIVKF